MPKGVYPHTHRSQPPATPTLTEEEMHQVARWMGEFHPPAVIPKLIADTFHKKVDHVYAYAFQHRKRWSLLIDRYRQEWLVKVAEVPLAHQKYRLEKLQRLVHKLDAQVEEGSLASERYERRLLQVLDRARYEMEEKKADQHTWYFTNLNLNSYSDAELVQRREELLKRIQQFRLPVRTVTNGVGNGRPVLETTGSEDEADKGRSQDLGSSSGHSGGTG